MSCLLFEEEKVDEKEIETEEFIEDISSTDIFENTIRETMPATIILSMVKNLMQRQPKYFQV